MQADTTSISIKKIMVKNDKIKNNMNWHDDMHNCLINQGETLEMRGANRYGG